MTKDDRMRRLINRILLLTSGFGLLLATACQNNEPTSTANDQMEAELPFHPPVTLRIAYSYSDIELPEGDNSDNNFLTRYIEEQTGVAIKYDWEAGGEDNYKSMLNLAIRSNDLPDAFIVNREQFRVLKNQQLIEDLTDIYPRYASPLVKEIYDSTGGQALREASVDGKLYALPNVAIEADAPSYVWIRQDWLEKLKLQPPNTLQDMERIVRAFIKGDPDGNGKNDTTGIPVERTLVYGEKTGVHGLNGVFAAYHSFPKSWIYDGLGNVVYGSIQPEAKAALAKLSEWYKEGIIDSQFVLRKEINDLVTNNNAGVVFAPWWGPYWPLISSVSNDTKAEWRVYLAPTDAEGMFVTKTAPLTDRYLVVRKGYAYPEAALKVLNLLTKLERNQVPNWKAGEQLRTIAEQQGAHLRNYYPFDLLLDYPDAVVKRHDQLILALNREIELDSLDTETRTLYDNLLMEIEHPRKNLEAWSSSQAYLLGGAVSKKPMIKVESLFYDTTPSMEKKWAALQKLENETYLKILTGELPVDAFDSFAQTWSNQGGNQITQEVGEEVRKAQASEQP
ncbi:extracellular solute-binding protein [Paenibacillus harenae]|uniref:Aldouronate transport system substrate-binding protein n=1 Tax=Paenibacillus harenae TaxID=306543 RepID=A0ABT9TW16_PAEHA|nr:extracellular solute-binding protein [Paenibacillus harenae]MDQ0111282.1 putative aldouronate transport system substrate-binding protein [Paenibacillus harenae]